MKCFQIVGDSLTLGYQNIDNLSEEAVKHVQLFFEKFMFKLYSRYVKLNSALWGGDIFIHFWIESSELGPCKPKSESRIPPIWNLNPESKPFWKKESPKIALTFESQKVNDFSPPIPYTLGYILTAECTDHFCNEHIFLRYILRWVTVALHLVQQIPWIRNPWTSPYRNQELLLVKTVSCFSL